MAMGEFRCQWPFGCNEKKVLSTTVVDGSSDAAAAAAM